MIRLFLIFFIVIIVLTQDHFDVAHVALDFEQETKDLRAESVNLVEGIRQQVSYLGPFVQIVHCYQMCPFYNMVSGAICATAINVVAPHGSWH